MKKINSRRFIIPMFFSFMILAIFPANALSEETYVFERMWPTVQQPWYLRDIVDIAVSPSGYVYVAVSKGYIMKFTRDGQFVTKWGKRGSSDGEFGFHSTNRGGIAVDSNGYVYVADGEIHRIQKFTSDGQFVSKWGSQGMGNGEFTAPCGIAIDLDGYIYVADTNNHRIQKFTLDGEFVSAWGNLGSGDGKFQYPYRLSISSSGHIYVTDRENHRIQKFASDGQFVAKWGSQGTDDGQFDNPMGIAMDSNGYLYVADSGNNRLQKFTSDGKFVTKWEIFGWYEFDKPRSIAVDPRGYVYEGGYANGYIQKFTSSGEFITKWGSEGTGDGEFNRPHDMALDSNGYIYVADTGNNRIQKFTSDGQFVTQWGSYGTGDGQFNNPMGIGLGSNGYVYVVDEGNNRIQKFTPDGEFVTKWGTLGAGDGEFDFPMCITLDSNGYLYVADTGNNRLQKFTLDGRFVAKIENQEWHGESGPLGPVSVVVDVNGDVYIGMLGHSIYKYTSNGEFVTQWGDWGYEPGLLDVPAGVALDPTGKVYVIEYANNRIQVFKKITVASSNKAIVVAGGGPYLGNNLWDATQMCANFAYRTLTYQGFTKENIYYLSSDTGLDLDNNGEADDVDADVTNNNLKTAITTWALDAESLVIYLVDHGGNNTFRMSGTETLSVSSLDTWLDQLQGIITGNVVTIYDACESGSFVSSLRPPSGKERIVITSTSPGENAYFLTQGSISFSNYFWTEIFNGLNVYNAFSTAKEAIGYTSGYQNPLLDDNGNGVGNETGDGALAQNTYIGNGTVIQGDAPVIENVSPDQTMTGTASALLYASNVTDSDGISRVWAVIRPPDYGQGSPDNPVQSLPSIDLTSVGGDRYEATYEAFTTEGTYQIAIYARDRIGNTSIPKLTTVSVGNPLTRKAIIVVGGSQSDSIWSGIEKSALLAYQALTFQGYKDNDIDFMSSVTFSAGVDGAPSSSNLSYAIGWAKPNTQDLVLFMVGNGDQGTFQVTPTDSLSASDLDSWLDSLQKTLPGKVTVIYDASLSGSFLKSLVPPAGKERILISSTSGSQAAHFVSEGKISFSSFFWTRVLNGANVRDSFLHGKKAIVFSGDGQVPQLDDTGNGIGNEKADGQLARNYTIGAGIMLAGDDPIVGSVSPAQTLSGETSATLWAKDVTSTGTIDKVWAVITPPNYLTGSNSPITDLPTLDLTSLGNNRYDGTYADFTLSGTYNIAVFAMDTRGNLSLPVQTTVMVTNGCLSVAGDLSIWVPCAEYNGSRYSFTLNFYNNPDDPSGYYWKLAMATLTGGTGTDCIPISNDLSMPVSCVAYNGTQYGFTLKFYNNSYDPSGLYWKMDMSTLKVK